MAPRRFNNCNLTYRVSGSVSSLSVESPDIASGENYLIQQGDQIEGVISGNPRNVDRQLFLSNRIRAMGEGQAAGTLFRMSAFGNESNAPFFGTLDIEAFNGTDLIVQRVGAGSDVSYEEDTNIQPTIRWNESLVSAATLSTDRDGEVMRFHEFRSSLAAEGSPLTPSMRMNEVATTVAVQVPPAFFFGQVGAVVSGFLSHPVIMTS